jgi:hypothetical protein
LALVGGNPKEQSSKFRCLEDFFHERKCIKYTRG